MADRQIKSSPLNIRVTINTIAGPTQVLPDGITAAALHNQFIGNFQGLSELQQLLDTRKVDLEAILEQQRKDNPTQ